MSWLALLLIGIGCTDLAHSVRHTRFVPGVSGAMTVLVVGLLAGLTGWPDLVAVVALAGFAFAWELAVTRGFGRRQPWLPLVVLGACLAVVVLLSGQAGAAAGPFGEWLAQVPLPVLRDLDPDEALLLAGVVLVQLSTGNVLVRLVLAEAGTISPDAQGGLQGPERRLKGGRLLGPLERLFILGFGLAGQFTAAAVVVAAKGLLRWPELTSRLEQERVHRLTEYFLVGSFVSWLVALCGLTATGLVPLS
jgi:hypothetical protein